MSEKFGQNPDVGTHLSSSSKTKVNWLATRVALLTTAIANILPTNAQAQQPIPGNLGQGPSAAPATTLATSAVLGDTSARAAATKSALEALQKAMPTQGGKDSVGKLILLAADRDITAEDTAKITEEGRKFYNLNSPGGKGDVYGLSDELAAVAAALKIPGSTGLSEAPTPPIISSKIQGTEGQQGNQNDEPPAPNYDIDALRKGGCRIVGKGGEYKERPGGELEITIPKGQFYAYVRIEIPIQPGKNKYRVDIEHDLPANCDFVVDYSGKDRGRAISTQKTSTEGGNVIIVDESTRKLFIEPKFTFTGGGMVTARNGITGHITGIKLVAVD